MSLTLVELGDCHSAATCSLHINDNLVRTLAVANYNLHPDVRSRCSAPRLQATILDDDFAEAAFYSHNLGCSSEPTRWTRETSDDFVDAEVNDTLYENTQQPSGFMTAAVIVKLDEDAFEVHPQGASPAGCLDGNIKLVVQPWRSDITMAHVKYWWHLAAEAFVKVRLLKLDYQPFGFQLSTLSDVELQLDHETVLTSSLPLPDNTTSCTVADTDDDSASSTGSEDLEETDASSLPESSTVAVVDCVLIDNASSPPIDDDLGTSSELPTEPDADRQAADVAESPTVGEVDTTRSLDPRTELDSDCEVACTTDAEATADETAAAPHVDNPDAQLDSEAEPIVLKLPATDKPCSVDTAAEADECDSTAAPWLDDFPDQESPELEQIALQLPSARPSVAVPVALEPVQELQPPTATCAPSSPSGKPSGDRDQAELPPITQLAPPSPARPDRWLSVQLTATTSHTSSAAAAGSRRRRLPEDAEDPSLLPSSKRVRRPSGLTAVDETVLSADTPLRPQPKTAAPSGQHLSLASPSRH